jgi:hypothetical protein
VRKSSAVRSFIDRNVLSAKKSLVKKGEKSVKALDNLEHIVYNICIYVNAVTELSAGED